jgi:hypothetical protein
MLAKPARWSALMRKSPEPPAPVAREHASVRFAPCAAGARPISNRPCARIAEAGYGPAPVRLVAEGPPFFAGDTRAVIAQARAAIALDDPSADECQVMGSTR